MRALGMIARSDSACATLAAVGSPLNRTGRYASGFHSKERRGNDTCPTTGTRSGTPTSPIPPAGRQRIARLIRAPERPESLARPPEYGQPGQGLPGTGYSHWIKRVGAAIMEQRVLFVAAIPPWIGYGRPPFSFKTTTNPDGA